jgi:hypothetical protein
MLLFSTMKNFTITPRQFALAGKSTFTVHNPSTGNRFTFKVTKGKQETAPHFVKVMTGPDNESSFTYLGTIFNGTNYAHGRKSPISQEAPSAKAFAFVWSRIDNLPTALEFMHAGKCCRCGRKLTVPESIECGYGSECASKMGL